MLSASRPSAPVAIVTVDPLTDVIRVDGARIPPPRRHLYLVFHKPRGVVSTMDDPQGRSTIADYLGKAAPEKEAQVATVRCGGTCEKRPRTNRYDGAASCAVASSLSAASTAV